MFLLRLVNCASVIVNWVLQLINRIIESEWPFGNWETETGIKIIHMENYNERVIVRGSR